MPTYNLALDEAVLQDAFKSFLIKVIAPASGIHPDKIRDLQTLRQLNTDLSPLKMTQDIPYHSNTDEMRFKLLQEALFNEAEKTIIWSLRGGYGCARLIDKLIKLPKPASEKLFIGFSDNTALHLFFSQQWHWRSIHASGFSQILDPIQDQQNFLKLAHIITKSQDHASINRLEPINTHAKRLQPIRGRLSGGNLSIITNSIGTQWQIETEDTILFLEDVGEKGYRIDRMLNHLNQTQLLKKAKAIILGEFLNQQEDEDIAIAIARFANDSKLAIYKSNQFGHGKRNYPLIYNSLAEIKPSEAGFWELLMHL